MFDLYKDLEKYKGMTPYASELYGVYQPLLGWRSKLTQKWIQKGGAVVDPGLRRILNGWIKPGPTAVQGSPPIEFFAEPLEPGSGKSPFTVLLAKDLNSELMKLMQARVQTFVENANGALPLGLQWRQIIDINNLMDNQNGDMRIVNDRVAQRLQDEAQLLAGAGGISPAMTTAARAKHLEIMQYESQIAGFLLFHVGGNEGFPPDDLQKLFVVKRAPPLSELLRSPDPLASIDPNDRSGALSPVGFVHLFRQYFFDLGTFLGEPVEHVWLAPGTTIELVEVSTRRVLIERALETLTESTTRSERSSTLKDELSDAVKEENQTSTKLGVSQSNTVNLYVYQGTASASFGLENTRSNARETAHKQNREQSEKLASEIKQSFKSVFRTVTETTDTRSRRHVIQNNTQSLINYELRRKMRRVGVQVQDIGTRLCWQVFVDDPGRPLGLSELVHFAESPDLENLKEPDKIPVPARIAKKLTIPVPFIPILDYSNNKANYEYAYLETAETQYKGKHLSIIKADEDDDDSQTIFGPFLFACDPPQSGYVATDDLRIVAVQGNKIADIREKKMVNKNEGKFEIVMQRVNFGGENEIKLDVELVFEPTAAEIKRVKDANDKAAEKFEAEKQRLLKKSYMEEVRSRIEDAASMRSRPSWDLREEERTVIYRSLLQRLMLDSWKLPDNEANRRLAHVRSEIVRAIFDVDSMLYFVAPEWWMPRRRQGRLDLNAKIEGQTFSVTNDDVIKWGGEKRPDNYKVTEKSEPAKLGSSLGWLLQLDGDNLRNAFLNAPWVKAVIPIRAGRERAALTWLRAIEGAENDGWDAQYVSANADDAEFNGQTVGEVLETIADRLVAANDGITATLKSDEVFEHGFDPLGGGFDAGVAPNEVFSQWISVLPTDQVVAVEYKPTDLHVPDA